MVDFRGYPCDRASGNLKTPDTRSSRFRIDPQRFPCYPLGRYLRITQRQNRDGSTVAYYALAENARNAAAKRAEARVVHNFGRASHLDVKVAGSSSLASGA